MWIVDTCIVLDIFENDPQFGLASARLLEKLLADGLAVSPVTMVELAPAFEGEILEQKRFLEQAGISHSEVWNFADSETAYRSWNTYIQARRADKLQIPKRPIADLLIGGFAANRQGLVTRNPSDFRRWFPKMKIREP